MRFPLVVLIVKLSLPAISIFPTVATPDTLKSVTFICPLILKRLIFLSKVKLELSSNSPPVPTKTTLQLVKSSTFILYASIPSFASSKLWVVVTPATSK